MLHSLLSTAALLVRPPQTLLLQGISRAPGPPASRAAATLFSDLSDVRVLPVEVGYLGSSEPEEGGRLGKALDLLRLAAATPRLVALARRFHPDVVYSAQQKWDLRLATSLARWLGLPHVVHLHYTVGPWLGHGTVRALRNARSVICVSEFIRRDAGAALPDRTLHVLHNSVELPALATRAERAAAKERLCRELNLPHRTLLVGMNARLSPGKGQRTLVEAMAPILRRRRDVHLLLAGQEYPPRNGIEHQLRILANQLGVAWQVHLLGWRGDVGEILPALDVFAHPSRHEPFGLAVLEAMAHGLPVVALREGGSVELVADASSGILTEPGDTAGLTMAVDLLLADGRMRRRIGAAGRDRAASHFDREAAAVRFLSLLEEAVGAEARFD